MAEMHIMRRDPDAYKRFKHNMARYKKYGAGNRMDLNLKPPALEASADIVQSAKDNACLLAKLYREMEVNGNG